MENPKELSDEGEVPNLGLADVMHKILKTSKPRKKKTIVLAKAKKLSAKQVIGSVKEEKDLLSNNKVKVSFELVNNIMFIVMDLLQLLPKSVIKLFLVGTCVLVNYWQVNFCWCDNGV